jgi:hypothetical protein
MIDMFWHNKTKITDPIGATGTELLASNQRMNMNCHIRASLNLLEPFGPVQACNGIALPLPLPLTVAQY